MYQFKAKDLKIKEYPLCLGNISKDFTIDNIKKKQSQMDMYMMFLLIIILMIINDILDIYLMEKKQGMI